MGPCVLALDGGREVNVTGGMCGEGVDTLLVIPATAPLAKGA